MTSRTYATLDRNRLGPGLLLDDSDLQITTSIACDGARKVLGSLPVMSGEYAFECYMWSTSQGDLSGLVSIGVAQPDSPLDAGVGSDAKSFGFWPADGVVKSDGSTVASPGGQPERVCIGVHLSLGPSTATCTFLVNGAVVSTVDLPTGKAWLPALTLGGSSAADINAAVNFGGWRFDCFDNSLRSGWSQQSAGLATIYLSLASDAFMSSPGDSPANTPFAPCVLNAQQFSINSSVRPWALRSDSRANPASITTLNLDNSKGLFNDLRNADLKGSKIVLQVPIGMSRGVGSLATSKTVMTGILEDVRGATIVSVTIRDMLTNFDRTMRSRRIPPFYDATTAGQNMPYGIGAQRNIKPLILDEPSRTYLLGDAIYTNVVNVADMAAPLDPNATPPQYTPAVNHSGIATQTDPVGRLSADASTVGPQSDLPGAEDVLDGTGMFAGWSNAFVYDTVPPPDCEFSAVEANGALCKMMVSPSTVLRIRSNVTWWPQTGNYGEWLKIRTDEPLLGGRAYRLSFYLYGAYSAVTGGSVVSGGLMFRTALDNDPASAIVGGNNARSVVTMAASNTGVQYVVDFRVPYGASRDLYMIATAATSGNGGTTSQGMTFVDVRAVRCELLGQFTTLPLADATVTAALTDILVDREGEDASVFDAGDAAAITEPLRLRYETPPNVLDAIVDIADVSGSVPYTDELGDIRLAKIRFPKDNDEVVADFSATNADTKNLVLQPLAAPGLTTQFGCRPNCEKFGDSDFVSDAAVATPALKKAYTSDCQIEFSTSSQVAQEYIANVNAARRTINVDDPAVARAIAEDVVGDFKIKGQYCQFVAYFEWSDAPCLGLTTKVWPQKLYPGMVIAMHDPMNGLINQKMTVVDRQLYPCAGKFMIGGIFQCS